MKPIYWLSAIAACLRYPSPASGQRATTMNQRAASTNTEILLEKIKADEKLLVATNMDLTDAEAAKFCRQRRLLAICKSRPKSGPYCGWNWLETFRWFLKASEQSPYFSARSCDF